MADRALIFHSDGARESTPTTKSIEGKATAIRAVVFDIGGVLEITPKTGWQAKWEERLQLQPGDLSKRLHHVWKAGSYGECTEADVERDVRESLGLDQEQSDGFMADLWAEYLGTPNTELIEYFGSLRSRCRTAILSNSFVGARRREQELYKFEDLCELIVYSHEVGIGKPHRPVYELTCERLGLKPEEIIFLDDVPVCVEGAKEVGIHGVLFVDNAQAIAEIEALLAANA